MKPGPKKGYKQTAEHIAKRKMWGPDHPLWKGDDIKPKSGRSRALRRFPVIGPCTECGAKKSERHHIDGDTTNNHQSNVAILCRRCHMQADGRAAARLTLLRGRQKRHLHNPR